MGITPMIFLSKVLLLFKYPDKKAQSTPIISNSKGLTVNIRTLTYQSWESEENNKLNNHI